MGTSMQSLVQKIVLWWHEVSWLDRMIPIAKRHGDNEGLELFGEGLRARFQDSRKWLEIKREIGWPFLKTRIIASA